MEPGQYDIAKSTLELGPLTANARGGKNASVTLNGKPIKIHLKNCTTPFECAGFGGGDRVRVVHRSILDPSGEPHSERKFRFDGFRYDYVNSV